jgi:hypothetical protein
MFIKAQVEVLSIVRSPESSAIRPRINFNDNSIDVHLVSFAKVLEIFPVDRGFVYVPKDDFAILRKTA